jgi:nonsense-mediated mRNA decay protein 3
LDIQRESPNSSNPNAAFQVAAGAGGSKFCLAEVQIAKSSDLGVNDTQYTVMTHLGNLLRPGDTVMGYDVSATNINDNNIKGLKNRDLPEVILIRKTYPNRKDRHKHRKYKLKQLDKEATDNVPKKHELKKAEEDYEQFLQEIDEDPDMRQQINLYRAERMGANAVSSSTAPTATEEDKEEDDGFPEVQLDELLMDLANTNLEASTSADPEMAVDADDEVNDLDESDMPLHTYQPPARP